MAQSNVDQSSPLIGVGFGPVVVAREIYCVPGTTEIGNKLRTPVTSAVALLDMLYYQAEGILDIAPAGYTGIPAGLAANSAVVNSTGVWGYKPQSGDDLALRKKGKFYLVNVEGALAAGDKLEVGATVAGAVGIFTSHVKVGFVTKGNAGVAGGPIEAWIDLLQPAQA